MPCKRPWMGEARFWIGTYGSLDLRFVRLVRRVVLALLKWTGLLALLSLMGIVVGIIVLFFPPLVLIAVLGFAAAILLWVMPDIDIVSPRFLESFFFAAVVIQLVVPQYYALAIPGVAWLSIRRSTWLLFVCLAALSVAASQPQRKLISQRIAGTPLLSGLILFYLACIVLSTVLSPYKANAVKGLFESVLYWYFAFLGGLLCIRSESQLNRFYLFVVATIFFSVPIGVAEMLSQQRLLFEILPRAIVSGLFADNPALLEQITTPMIRNGLYRSSFTFIVPLSFGEYLAMCAPIALFLGMHGRTTHTRTLGLVAVPLSLIGIFSSGSRGAYISAGLSLSAMIGCWLLRQLRVKQDKFLPGIMAVILGCGMLGAIGVFLASGRLLKLFTGGSEASSSTSARFDQWVLAQPQILKSPLWGYGPGSATEVVGYYAPGSLLPTIDTSIISVLVETGLLGFIAFFGGTLAGVLLSMRTYVQSDDRRAEAALAVGCALLSFLVYRLTLSQRENYTFAFVLLGIATSLVSQYSTASKRQRLVHTAVLQTGAKATPRS